MFKAVSFLGVYMDISLLQLYKQILHFSEKPVYQKENQDGCQHNEQEFLFQTTFSSLKRLLSVSSLVFRCQWFRVIVSLLEGYIQDYYCCEQVRKWTLAPLFYRYVVVFALQVLIYYIGLCSTCRLIVKVRRDIKFALGNILGKSEFSVKNDELLLSIDCSQYFSLQKH